MRTAVLCLASTALLLASQALGAQAASVHLLDSTPGYLRPQSQAQALSGDELSVLLKSMLSLPAVQALPSGSSAKIDSILTPDLFTRPSAVLALQLSGVSEEQLQGLLGAHQSFAFSAQTKAAAAELAQTVGEVAATSSAQLARLPLDHTGLPGCSDACVEESLKAFLQQAGANYTGGTGPMTGTISFRSAATGLVQLDLQAMPERLWATELATLHQTAKDAAAEKLRWEAQQQQPSAYITIAEATLVGMQALKRVHGEDSAQVKAAWSLLAAAVTQARSALLQAHDDRVVTVVSLLGDVPTRYQPGKIGDLVVWQDVRQQRSLLQAGTVSQPHIQYFTIAAAWSSSLLILAFAVAGCYCLSNMQFKQDSLLYPQRKND